MCYLTTQKNFSLKTIKDNFSRQAADYSKYRPSYPKALYDFIYSHCKQFENALDCASGNGQVALTLSTQFEKVSAIDISNNQIAYAVPADNVEYSVQRAESTIFPDESFDLITVGQAYHWFDFEAFVMEANRLLKPEGLIAIWSYSVFRVNRVLNEYIDDFFYNVTGPYWDPERKWVDNQYQDIPFDFDELPHDFTFEIKNEFTLEELEGYLNTCSAVHHYIIKEGKNPVTPFIKRISSLWQESMPVVYPGFIRIGRKKA